MHENKQPFLASPLTEDALRQTKEAARLLREDPAAKRSGKMAIEAIYKMTEISLEYYFYRPMDQMNIGMISRNIVRMGVNAGLGVLQTFGGQLINTLNTHQKVLLADHLEQAIIFIDPDSLNEEQ